MGETDMRRWSFILRNVRSSALEVVREPEGDHVMLSTNEPLTVYVRGGALASDDMEIHLEEPNRVVIWSGATSHVWFEGLAT